MSTPFDSIRSLFRPTDISSPSLQEANTTLKKLDSALDTTSKVADSFIKEGIPKTTTLQFLSKLGIVGNFVSTSKAYQEGDASEMISGGAKIIGAMDPGSNAKFTKVPGGIGNIADGISNGIDLAKGLDQGDMQKAAFAGMKLCMNVMASGSAAGMLLIGAGEFAFDAIKNNPEGFRLHSQETRQLMRGGADDNYIGA